MGMGSFVAIWISSGDFKMEHAMRFLSFFSVSMSLSGRYRFVTCEKAPFLQLRSEVVSHPASDFVHWETLL